MHLNPVVTEAVDLTESATILHRRGDRVTPIAAGRALAASIAGARLVELDGDAHLPYCGDRVEVVAEVESFLTDMPTVINGPLRLATTLVVRVEDAAAIARLRHAIEHERGLPLAERVGELTAWYDAPAAALRAARGARLDPHARHARRGLGARRDHLRRIESPCGSLSSVPLTGLTNDDRNTWVSAPPVPPSVIWTMPSPGVEPAEAWAPVWGRGPRSAA